MTIYTSSHVFHDDATTGYTVQQDYVLASVGAGYKITKIQVSGQVSFDAYYSTAGETGIYFEDFMACGIQYGPAGYDPYPLGSGPDWDENLWLYGALLPPAAAIYSVAPDTDTFMTVDRYPFDITIYPQLPVPSGGYGVEFSLSPTVTPEQGFHLWGSGRVWYHG